MGIVRTGLTSKATQNGAAGYAELFRQDRTQLHWSLDYAQRLMKRRPAGSPVVIQTSMSPSGRFHIGNFRDTVSAYLVQQALKQLGRDSTILLSFDDFDPVRSSQADSQNDLADLAHRPLGSGAQRTQQICRQYIRELKAVGICPSDADDDGHTAYGASWQTHYQYERYMAGIYSQLQRHYFHHRRKLAKLLDTTPSKLFSIYCEQCERNTTEILGRGARGSLRYSCRSCGAIVSTNKPRGLKPAWALDWTLRVVHQDINCEPAGQDHCTAGSTMDRTRIVFSEFLKTKQPVIVPYGLVRQQREAHKISGSHGGGLTVSDLLKVMPAPMILWLYARPNCRSDFRISLERSAVFRYYDEWDRFVKAAARGAELERFLFELISNASPNKIDSELPRFRTLVGLLHGACYDWRHVADSLQDSADNGTPSAVIERVKFAHSWLSTFGANECWINQPRPTASAVDLTTLLTDGALSGTWARHRYDALYASLFGTRNGPPLHRLIDLFGEHALVKGIETHDQDGSQPLRRIVLDNLVKSFDNESSVSSES